MKYLLDTNIVLGYLKQAPYAQYLENNYEISSPQNITTISIVTYAELFSFSIRGKWGENRKEILHDLLTKLPVIFIDKTELAEKFAEIHAYCQNKHPLNPKGFSAIELSHNDIWIAATAALSKSILITTDKDFLPLDKIFFDLLFVDQSIK